MLWALRRRLPKLSLREGLITCSLKGDQGTMHRDVIAMFDEATASEFKGISHRSEQTIEKGHGRIETRRFFLVDDPLYLQCLNPKGPWSKLHAIGMVQSEREERSCEQGRPLLFMQFGECSGIRRGCKGVNRLPDHFCSTLAVSGVKAVTASACRFVTFQ